jgi:hypothetical protein
LEVVDFSDGFEGIVSSAAEVFGDALGHWLHWIIRGDFLGGNPRSY